jgi:hypothetical protein
MPYVTWGTNSRPIGGRSSDTVSPIDMNNNNNKLWKYVSNISTSTWCNGTWSKQDLHCKLHLGTLCYQGFWINTASYEVENGRLQANIDSSYALRIYSPRIFFQNIMNLSQIVCS